MAMIQRGRIGLKDIYYAVLTESTDVVGGTPSYATPVPLAISAEFSFDPSASTTPYYGDDAPRAVGETVGAGKISAKFLDVIPSSLADMLGITYAAGQLSFGNVDNSRYVAIMGRQLMNGSDGSGNAVYEYFVLYKIMFGKPKRDMKTKAGSINFQEIMLDGLEVALVSLNKYFMTQRTDDTFAVAATTNAWFTSVQLPGGDSTGLTVVATQGGSNTTSTVILTFSKVSGLSFRINFATITALSARIQKGGVAQAGTFVDTSGAAGTTQVVTFSPTSPWATAQKIEVNVDGTAKDNSNIGATFYTIELTLS